MSGPVITTLRASPWLKPLTQAELVALAGCSSRRTYQPGQLVLDPRDERVFILRQGRLALHLTMLAEGDHCGGEADYELGTPGDALGWATWVYPDRIIASAVALEAAELVIVDMARVKDTSTFLKLSQRMLQNLYGRLQEGDICPPNVRGFLKLGDARCLSVADY
jgi:CRP-like cAMP-binding protein